MGLFKDAWGDVKTSWEANKPTWQTSVQSFIPEATSTGSVEGDIYGQGIKGALNGFLTGNFMGGIQSIGEAVSTIFNPDKYRQKAVQSRLNTIWGAFNRSSKTLKDINVLFAETGQKYAHESTKNGDYEKKYLEAIQPLELALKSDGYTYKEEYVSNVKYPYTKKVWSEPVSFFESIGDAVSGGNLSNSGSSSMVKPLLFGGLVFGLFKIFQK